MNKVITIVILAAIGLGVWKFWPDIMGKVKEAQKDDEKTEENEDNPKNAPEGGNTPAVPPVGPSIPAPPVGGNNTVPPPPVGNNTDPLGTNVPPDNRQNCEVLLEAHVGPDLTGSTLFVEVKVASTARLDIVDYRISGKDIDTGWKNLTFTPTGFRGGVTTYPQEILIEIRIDPDNQSPPAKQLIGAQGELLDGPFVREEGQKKVVYASAKLRPNKLKFSARNPTLKLALAGAVDVKETP